MEENRVQDASDTPYQQEGLPHEALFLVLVYLPLYELLVMAQVCRSVKEVLTGDILPWLNIMVGKPLNKRFNDAHLLKITSKADGRLKTLALLNCSKITDEGLQQVIARNPYITRLWLPACTSLSPSGVIEAVKLLTKDEHRLKSLRINGIYNLKKADLELLHRLVADENHPWQKNGSNFYHEYKEFSTFKHSNPPIDVEICPKCNEIRVVFDCPRDSCKRMRQQQKLECRGCQLCIPRCEECGICIKDEDPVEAACVDALCLGCWLQLPKCSFCNKPYCSQHADQKCSLVGSSGFVCIDCHTRFIKSFPNHILFYPCIILYPVPLVPKKKKKKKKAMAELFVPKIADALGDVVMKQFRENVNLVMGVEQEVKNISSKLETIEKLLHDAERRRLKEKHVGIWLQKLEDITYEMDDVLDEWNFKIQKSKNEGTYQNARMQPILQDKVCSFISSLCPCLKQVPVRSAIALKIQKINEQLELILKEADQFKFISNGGIPDSQDFKRIMTTSIIDESEVFGRASDEDALLGQILSESSSQGRDGVQVICIVGAGGSGKTTLAQLLFNDDRVKNHFELKKWVCVSDPFDEKRIARAILEVPGKSSPDLSELESLLQLMKETFSGKRFLLVLDDVWTKDDSKWKPFRDTFKVGAPRSVILVTTRSQIVARVVGTTHTHQMTLLSHSDCWLIMQSIAFAGRSEEWCKKVESIGQKIAEKCKGLPLAAKTMGSLLRFKDTIQQWQNILDSEVWQLEEAAVELFPHLYLSYNELSPELKRCFSYCAVFPKDHEIYVEELIRLWIAQGYVRPSRRGECLELMGREYFNNLAMRSFFQELEKQVRSPHEYWGCKMHDIVHDFAQFVTNNECLVLDKIDSEQGTGRNSLSEKVRHLTWLGTEQTLISQVLDVRRLRSFLKFSYGRVVPPDLFHSLKCVRTLTLSKCVLREVPVEIGSLIHLRCLDLSQNPFTALPEAICDLYYLETFDISWCESLSCLPQRIEGLVHLRHLLNFRNSHSLQIPQGLGKLTSLCTLTRFIARSNSDDLAILKHLNQLKTLCVSIQGEVDVGSAELGKKINMREMALEFSDGAHFTESPSWIETMEPPPNLQRLRLDGYPGTQLPSWLVTGSLINNLTSLIIGGPCNISSLPNLWKLSSLEELVLFQVEKLKYLGKEFFGITKAVHETSHNDTFDASSNSKSSSSTESVAFPNLRILEFYSLRNWTNWEDLSEDDEKVAFSIMPRLEELRIQYCRKLEALPHRILGKISSLKSLDVIDCFKLRDRYSDKAGDDWMKISHIPRVHLYES